MLADGPLRVVAGPETEKDREIARMCEGDYDDEQDGEAMDSVGVHRIPRGVRSLIHNQKK